MINGIGARARTLRKQRRIPPKNQAQFASQINQIRTGVDPILQIRDCNETRWINKRMGSFDDHVARGIDVNTRRVTRVRFDKPDDDRDVISDRFESHRNGAVCLEKIDGAAVVVSEGSSFGFERRESGGEGEEVLTDEPFGVFGVREGRRAALGEDGGEELLDCLVVWCCRNHRIEQNWI